MVRSAGVRASRSPRDALTVVVRWVSVTPLEMRTSADRRADAATRRFDGETFGVVEPPRAEQAPTLSAQPTSAVTREERRERSCRAFSIRLARIERQRSRACVSEASIGERCVISAPCRGTRPDCRALNASVRGCDGGDDDPRLPTGRQTAEHRRPRISTQCECHRASANWYRSPMSARAKMHSSTRTVDRQRRQQIDATLSAIDGRRLRRLSGLARRVSRRLLISTRQECARLAEVHPRTSAVRTSRGGVDERRSSSVHLGSACNPRQRRPVSRQRPSRTNARQQRALDISRDDFTEARIICSRAQVRNQRVVSGRSSRAVAARENRVRARIDHDE